MAKSLFNHEDIRLNYGEMLQPEIGFDVEFAVALTYSLDLEALLGVPISLGMLDDMDTNLKENPLLLLEAINKSSDKIAIFCNAGSISLPQHIQSVFALLEGSVFEVKLRNKQNFHPKMWFIKYVNEEGDSYIKLIVLSRNLTFDRCFDYAIEMVGKLSKRKSDKNAPLADMLKYVAKCAKSRKRKKILSLAEDLMYVKNFELDERFEDYEFIPLGLDKTAIDKTMLGDSYYDLFVVSPFLSDSIIAALTDKANRKSLITRKSSLNNKILASFDDVYITKDFILNNEIATEEQNSHQSNQDIHAKIYFTSGYNGNYLYIGSANASQNAFYKNVEFLIKLKFSKYMTSYNTIIKDFFPEEGCPFEKISIIEEQENQEDSKVLDKVFKDIIWSIKDAKVTSNDDKFTLTVLSAGNSTDKSVFIAPMFRNGAFIRFEEEMTFTNMPLKELCEFYIIKIEDKQVVVKINTDGIPDGRDQAIYKSIIQTSNGFLAYVSFALSDNSSEAYFEQKELMKQLLSGEDDRKVTFHTALYEKMLQCTVSHPNKLLDLENIMKMLDEEIVTEDFKKMYLSFKEIAKKRMMK